MIAVDSNILVYAHREDSPWHEASRECVGAGRGPGAWAIPWPCLHEFLAIATHAGYTTPRRRSSWLSARSTPGSNRRAWS